MPAATLSANTQANSGKAGRNRRPARGARQQTGAIFLRRSISRTWIIEVRAARTDRSNP